ncbi:MAG: efflux RND transporter periplasmic adaptor subunit [Bacteroidota bacterium]
MDRVLKKKKWPVRRIVYTFVLPLVAGLLIWLMVRATGSSRLRVETDRLTISNVSFGPFQEFIPINGEVLPLTTRYVTALAGGQVEEVYMEGGEFVKAGDIILKLSNPDQELQYMQLETSLLEQADQLRNTRITLEERGLNLQEQLLRVENDLISQGLLHRRNEELYKDSVISKNDYEATKYPYELSLKQKDLTEVRIARDSQLTGAQLEQVEFSLQMVRTNLVAVQQNRENFTIKAPTAGLLSSIRVELGETVNQGQQIGQIDVMQGYKVRAQIDEHYIARIEPGLKGQFTFSGSPYILEIRKVYPEVLQNGAFEVDMEFLANGTPEGIKRGQNLQIRLALSEEEQALMIPRGGFFNSTGGNWVYVVDPEGNIATKRNIRINRQSDRFYEVTEGLVEGEKVITSGYDNFNEIDILVLQ